VGQQRYQEQSGIKRGVFLLHHSRRSHGIKKDGFNEIGDFHLAEKNAAIWKILIVAFLFLWEGSMALNRNKFSDE